MPTARASGPGREGGPLLIEREQELAALRDVIDRALAGTGAAVLVEAGPGLGKSTLVEAASGLAEHRGVLTLTARGSELERDLPWSGVRDVFGPLLERLPPAQRSRLLSGAAALAAPLFDATTAVEAEPAATLHGLYWLTAGLAARQPLLIAVDDAHWLDQASMRWLAHLAGRISDLPVVLLAASRPITPGDGEAHWWTAEAHTEALRLAASPLSEGGSYAVVKALLGDNVDTSFAAAAHEATGGNPFLLRELLRELRAEEVAPTAASASRVAEIRPDAVARSVLLRINRLGQPAVQLAFAVTVLGANATLTNAASLAQLELDAAASAADALAAADVLRASSPLEFVHPIARGVVAEELPLATRLRWHARAADLLRERGASAEEIAVHLLATEPAGRSEVVTALREAASKAIALAAPEPAIRALRRALNEPPAPDQRVAVLHELARAGATIGDEDCLAHFREASSTSTDAHERGLIALGLGSQLMMRGAIEEAEALCQGAATELDDSELDLRLNLLALVLTCRAQDPQRQPDVERPEIDASQIEGRTRGERLFLGAWANEKVVHGPRSLPKLGELASRALADGAMLRDVGSESAPYWGTVTTLMFAERYDETELALDAGRDDARRRGSASGYALACAFRSVLDYRLGRLGAAVAGARESLELITAERLPLANAYAASFLIDALTAQGAVGEAEDAVADMLPDGAPPLAAFALLRAARGRLRLAQGRPREAAVDLKGAGEVLGSTSPAVSPWRPDLALALHACDETRRARALLAEELEIAARDESRWAQAIALRAAAAVGGGDLDLLQRAAAVVDGTPLALERARISADLGGALRRAGRARDAAPWLREALDLAERCGAAPVAEQARVELRATGARPRRSQRSGVDALTASELRVARMAATGASNRDIAQALFVSLRTVETHLTHAYDKLGVAARSGLAEALGAESEGV